MSHDDAHPDGRRDPTGSAASRRAVLGALAAGAASAGGCVQRVQNIVGVDADRSLSLAIKTTPANADEQAITLARDLAANLRAVGVDTSVVPMATSQLYRDVLVNHDFDAYVARCPGYGDPDFLRPLLHSRFAGDLGWQNPFGFADLDVDDLLVAQRTAPDGERRRTVSTLQRDVVRQQPFTVVAFPDEIRAVRPDRYRNWGQFDPGSPLNYLALRPERPARTATPAGDGGGTRLRLATTDGRVTENFNPLMVEFRTGTAFTDLVYDRLARRYAGGIRPWLAASVTWETDPDAPRQRATVALREGARWHDGRPVAASDVAFTYAFLADTWLGKREVPAPAPRFHGRVSLVEGAEAVGERTVRLSFVPCRRDVAARALDVPVLPEREWRLKATEPSVAGFDLSDGLTEALVWNNPDPVGSGPLRFENSVAGEQLVLSRFEDHFLGDGAVPGVTSPLSGGVPFDELGVRVVPSSAVAVALAATDRADATAPLLDPEVVPRIGRRSELRLLATPSRSFYHVGYNARRAPLSNPRFRRAVARLVDRAHAVSDAFDGYATPGVSPLSTTNWLPPALEWTGESPVLPFLGEDGDLDVERAREAFREAGYRLAAQGGDSA